MDTKKEDRVQVPKIISTKQVYVVWTNTDLTEGRGGEVPIFVCETPETAKRLSQGRGVMGTNADVAECTALRITGTYHWLVPGIIVPPSKEDKVVADKRKAYEDAMQKAKELGLSETEIAALLGDGT